MTMVPATSKGQELALQRPVQIQHDDDIFQPKTVGEAFELAGILARSRLMPKGLEAPEAIFTVVMTGRELGLSVMQSIRSIYVWNGKPTLAAELMVALVKNSKACVSFQLVETTDRSATYKAHRVGEEPTPLTYTIEQAQKAGLVGKDVWKHHPAAMLRARASAALCRAVFPDVTLGIYATEEADDPEMLGAEAPKQIEVKTLQQQIAEASGAPTITEDEIRAALEAGVDGSAVKATATDLTKRFPAHRTFIKSAFEDVKKARLAAIAAAAAPAVAPPAEKSEPRRQDDQSDGEPPADVKLVGDDDRGDDPNAY